MSDRTRTVAGTILLAAIISYGYAAHMMRPWLRRIGPAWTELSSYTSGSLMVLTTVPFTMSFLHDELMATDDRDVKRLNIIIAMLATCISYGAFGIGVVAGWMTRPDEYED